MIYRKLVEERFRTFHKNHPEVYEQFKQVAYELFAAVQERQEKYSATFLFAIMHYHAILANKPRVKVQSSYMSRYAGLLVSEDEKFRKFFVWHV